MLLGEWKKGDWVRPIFPSDKSWHLYRAYERYHGKGCVFQRIVIKTKGKGFSLREKRYAELYVYLYRKYILVPEKFVRPYIECEGEVTAEVIKANRVYVKLMQDA